MKTAVEFFNNELDDILQLYPSEWKDIQLIYIEAKKLEKKQLIDFAKYILHQNHEYKSYTDIINEWFEQN
jgi:tRNA1(Val) A37 N6-methylase TrmN6